MPLPSDVSKHRLESDSFELILLTIYAQSNSIIDLAVRGSDDDLNVCRARRIVIFVEIYLTDDGSSLMRKLRDQVKKTASG